MNTAQLAKEVQILRQNSSTFRVLEAAAAAAGYKTVEIQMGASLLPKGIADSNEDQFVHAGNTDKFGCLGKLGRGRSSTSNKGAQ